MNPRIKLTNRGNQKKKEPEFDPPAQSGREVRADFSPCCETLAKRDHKQSPVVIWSDKSP
jgi:hypothetical protein